MTPAGPSSCIGRERELAELAELIAAAGQEAAIVAVVGPSGIGKTALLQQLAAGQHSRWARAVPWESDLPGGVLAQLLPDDVPNDDVPVVPVPAAAHLVDHLRAAPPALLIVDDAQHADLVSLQAFSTVVRHHRELPVLVVLTAPTADALPAGIVGHAITLTGLASAAIAELTRHRGATLHPAMVDILTRHTSGNPRAVLALLDEVPAPVWTAPDAELPAPAYVTERVGRQLQICGPDGHALVDALAVLGDAAPLGEVAALARLDDPLAAIDAAAASGLLTPNTNREPTLADPLTRAAIIGLAGVRATAEAHRRAAEVVTDPARRLHHRVAAAPMPDAALAAEVDTLAHERGTDGAWAQAAILFRDAARLTPDPLLRDERLTRAVDALVAAGDCGAAAAMVPAVESLRETPLRNAVLGYLAILRGRATEAEVRLRRAADIVNVDREPDTAALIAQRYVLHSLARCRGSELVDWADRALALAIPDSPAETESAAVRGLGLLAAGHPRQASAAYDELSARVRRGAQAQRVAMGRGWVQLVRDDIDGARISLETAVATAGLGGSTRITLWSLAWLARVQFAVGDWDLALHSVEQARELAARSGIVLTTPLFEWTAAQISALRGDWPTAAAAVQTADTLTGVAGNYEMMRIPTLLARAQVAEAEADYPKVVRVLQPLTTMAVGTSLQEPGYWPWPDLLANALVLTGQLDAADTFLRPNEQRAKARGHRSAQARLGYARGRLLGAQGDIAGARRSFEAALEHLDGLPLRYDRARVTFAYGQTLRRSGKRRHADELIGTARELYLSLGANTYVARCDRELKAGGLHQLRGARGDVDLTPQEEAVTKLVAQGLSNREAAAELFVSAKTVQYHLTRIYAKLGVRSRSELAALRADRT